MSIHDCRTSPQIRRDLTLLPVLSMTMLVTASSLALEGEEAPLPESIVVTGTVRDFRERTDPGGHPDFEIRPDRGYARYSGNIATTLGEDRKPVFTGNGQKVASQYRDSEHRQICYALYDASLGDVEGSWSHESTGGIDSSESFNQWYNDVLDVNLSAPLELTLVRNEDGHYVFDDREDPLYIPLGGFFPIEDRLFGNPGGNPDRNFHFTVELHLSFEYESEGHQFFKFTGDDDVWVFVNDQLCIDLGGVHAAHDQYIDMNRLGLVDGEVYKIDFFYAERHRNTSNFRIETNFPVHNAVPAAVSNAFD